MARSKAFAVAPSDPRLDAAVGTVQAAAPGADGGMVRALVLELFPFPRELGYLLADLQTHPDALTSGTSRTRPGTQELVTRLHAVGIAVALPRCGRCGRERQRLAYPSEGGRVCRACRDALRGHRCARCGVRTGRVWHGNGRQHCPTCARAARLERIESAALEAFQQLERGQLSAALSEAFPDIRELSILGAELAADPGLWSSPGPRTIRLLKRLRDAGVDVPTPTCVECGRDDVLLPYRAEGGRRCHRCYEGGRPPARCSTCGRMATPFKRTSSGPLCQRCARGPLRGCERCTRTIKIHSMKQGEDLCARCYRLPQRICGQCGRPRQAFTDAGPAECPGCLSKHLQECGDCTGTVYRYGLSRSGERVCMKCELKAKLTGLLRGPDGKVRTEFVRLIELLLTVDDPRRALQWASRSNAAAALRRIAAGEVDLSHATLDEKAGDLEGSAASIEHARGLLVAAGALPPRSEHLARLERAAERLARGLHPQDRLALRAYASWRVLPRARRRTGTGRYSAESTLHGARAHIGVIARFLNDVRGDGRDVIDAALVEEWLGTTSPGYRTIVATYLRWASRQGFAPSLYLDSAQSNGPSEFLDPAIHWETARRALTDHRMPAADRLVLGLVLLYGQPIRSIVTLKCAHVTIGSEAVAVRLGRASVTLVEPLSDIVQAMVAHTIGGNSKDGSDPAPHDADGWLFPGRRHGQPMSAGAMQRRVTKYGITARAARNTALLELARDVPAAVIADLLGIHPGTAERWRRVAAGEWVTYAADAVVGKTRP